MNLLSMKSRLIALIIFGFCTNLNLSAQNVKSQSEQIKSLQLGKYIAVDVIKLKNGSYDHAPLKLENELIEVLPEPNFSEHKYFKMVIASQEKFYLPDNMAFPMTYAQLAYEGNEKLQKAVGYVPREIRKGSTNRVFVHDGVIFDLSTGFDEDSKESYQPYRLYVHESVLKENPKDDKPKKKLSLKERMMKKMAGKNSEVAKTITINNYLNGKEAVKKAIEYLEKAVAQKKEVYPKWIINSTNKTRLDLIEERRELMFAAMKKYNEDLMDTPEWRRIVENNRRAEAAGRANNVTIQNNTGRDIYIYSEGSMNGTRVNAGSSSTFDCGTSQYYAFDGNSGTRGGNAGPQAYSAGSGCGSTVTVQ